MTPQCRKLPTAFPQGTPTFATLGDLLKHRKQTALPHKSYDLSGDGFVTQREFFIASRFDTDKNGHLDDSEKAHAREEMMKPEHDEPDGSRQYREYKSLPRFKDLTRFDRTLELTVPPEKTTFKNTFNRVITDFEKRDDDRPPLKTSQARHAVPPTTVPNTRKHLLEKRRQVDLALLLPGHMYFLSRISKARLAAAVK
jgi:hypothetical protein